MMTQKIKREFRSAGVLIAMLYFIVVAFANAEQWLDFHSGNDSPVMPFLKMVGAGVVALLLAIGMGAE